MGACAHHSNSACRRAPIVMMAISDSFGRGTQCGIEHPFAPVDFLPHV